MALVDVKVLLEAGVHYGHRASRWNPKMRPYIYGKRNLIHIIDLRETVRGLLRAYKYLSQVVARGGLVMFVGTKRQAKEIVEREAGRAGMPFVSERWLGGTLTNYRTIRNRLKRLQELEAMWLPAGANPAKEDLNSYIGGLMTDAGKLDPARAPDTSDIRTHSKKMISTLSRELLKIRRNLMGIRDMIKLPDALVIVGPNKEHIAVKEAKRMGVTTIALIEHDPARGLRMLAEYLARTSPAELPADLKERRADLLFFAQNAVAEYNEQKVATSNLLAALHATNVAVLQNLRV